MKAAGENCIKAVDPLSGKVVDICEDRPVGTAPELPKAPDKYIDPKDYQYGKGCGCIDYLKNHANESKKNPLNWIRWGYDGLFKAGEWADDHTVGALADHLGLDPKESPNLRWWIAKGGAVLAGGALWKQLKHVRTTGQAVKVLQAQRAAAQAAGDTQTVELIDFLLKKPSEQLRAELLHELDNATTAGDMALANDFNGALNIRTVRGKTKPVDTDNVLGNVTLKQNEAIRKVRRTVVREAQAAVRNPATPAEARLALSRVLESPGTKNTWAILKKELDGLTAGSPEKQSVQAVVDAVQARHAGEIKFIDAVEGAVKTTEDGIYADLRKALSTPATGGVNIAEIDRARRALLNSTIADNLWGTADGVIRFPRGFAAHGGFYAELEKAKVEVKKNERAIQEALARGDDAAADLAKAVRDQNKLAAATLENLIKTSKKKNTAEILDAIDAAKTKAAGEGALGAATVKALDGVIEAGKSPIHNALGIGASSPLNLASEVAEGRSSPLRYARELTLGAYETSTAFRTWLSAWVTFAQLLHGPQEIVDATGGKDLEGPARAWAYRAAAYGGVGLSAWITNAEYSRMVSDVGRTKASVGYAFMLSWLFYQWYWYGMVDQREGMRLTGRDPNDAKYVWKWDYDRFYNPGRWASQYYAWVAETPLWALMPKFSLKLAEGIASTAGMRSKGETQATAAEQVGLLTDAEATALETAGTSIGRKLFINALRGGRAFKTAFLTSGERDAAFGLWFLTSTLSGTFLARAQNFARAVTEGEALQGGSIRPIFTGFGSQLLGSSLNALGKDMSTYTYYAVGMTYLFPWDYCNEIETGASWLAQGSLERYRQARRDSVERKQAGDDFRYFMQMMKQEDQEALAKKYMKSGVADKYPELFDGLASLTPEEHQRRVQALAEEMKSGIAQAAVPQTAPESSVMDDDPWTGHL